MPYRAEKVLHQIENCHGANLNDSRYGSRMRGEGKIAGQINNLVNWRYKNILKIETSQN